MNAADRPAGASRAARSRRCARLRAALPLAAALALWSGPGADARAQGTVHRDWTVVKLDGGCLATQQVHGRRTGAMLLEAVFSPSGGDGTVAMALRVPTGVHLPDGIAYRHAASDRVAVGLEWQQCTSSRCTAIALLSASEFGRMLRGREIIVGYRPLPRSRLLNLPLSLLGLTAAWRDVATCRPDNA